MSDGIPVVWRIVHPSGNVVFVEHEIVVSIMERERPLCAVINVDAVAGLYGSNEVIPLYAN